ncbi:L-aspartate oxidase [Brevundimonas sp. A19_0]|uniref:L-aspartate oxidase n=1 Tax=Brevundimonas sp. A19_0 TaxID=2821087 RepID=UPI001AD99281|nr:L-aspartate oxidase [Brevundimonas sp. A19_0]MBO9500450.1 L-aspartate oxidase [Brevundimonas sp. A19_0]
MKTLRHDGPLVIGAGLAGLSAALEAAPARVIVATPSPLLEACASAWAQGGMAAALAIDDSATLHAEDTVEAGAGLVEAERARALTEDARATIQWLDQLGAPFDRGADGTYHLSREAAHSRARVARVGGDGAGRAILSALVTAVRASAHVSVWDDARLTGLVQDETGRIRGAILQRGTRKVRVLAPAVILATGGIGGLYARTTTPGALQGEGMALAWMAGAEILDPEFVQFHPTAIRLTVAGPDSPLISPLPLATEALRGEGARLVDRTGAYLLGDDDSADLAPRDQVARAVFAAEMDGRGAFLNATRAIGEAFPTDFPAVFAACMRMGLDPRQAPIPVVAAAHYHMGGIAADADGRTTLAGLYAVGECAATGVHGANRLASNSLLEAAAFGRRAGQAARRETAGDSRALTLLAGEPLPEAGLDALRDVMDRYVGVVRDRAGLSTALDCLSTLDGAYPDALPLVAARLVVEAALGREESRGGHYRRDYPDTLTPARHSRLVRQTEQSAAPVLAAE